MNWTIAVRPSTLRVGTFVSASDHGDVGVGRSHRRAELPVRASVEASTARHRVASPRRQPGIHVSVGGGGEPGVADGHQAFDADVMWMNTLGRKRFRYIMAVA